MGGVAMVRTFDHPFEKRKFGAALWTHRSIGVREHVCESSSICLRHAGFDKPARLLERIAAAKNDVPRAVVPPEKGTASAFPLRPARYGVIAFDDDRMRFHFAFGSIPRRTDERADERRIVTGESGGGNVDGAS